MDLTKHRYSGYLLGAALFLTAAVAVYPFDSDIYLILRTFSHRVGKVHLVQEVLNLFRPFGKGDVILLIIAGLGLAGARRKAMHILLALLVLSALVWPVKLAVGRERPGFVNNHSFPSGDAATAVAFCTPLLTASPWTAPLAVVITGGVVAGRVYDGRHFPSDVLAGVAFGLVASAIALAVLRRWPVKPRRLWFLLAGLLILILSVLGLAVPWAHTTVPFVIDFIGVWAPLCVFLLIARLLPVCQRKYGTTPNRINPATGPRLPLFFILLFTVYLTLTTASSLWDRDEPRFSRATVEMVESGNYLFPTFNGQLRPDKPILIYWLMSVPVRLLGPSELSCRMIAPLATLVAALLTFWVTRRLAGRKTAFVAAMVLMLSPLMVVSGTAATTDALLLACITGTISSFLLSWLNGFRLWHLVLMILALAGAMLTKGPVGLAIPVLVIAAILIFIRGGAIRPLPYLGWLGFALMSATLLFLAWGLPANAATNGEFLRLGIGKHVVDRSVNAMESHGGKSFAFYFYYIPVLILTFFPWTLYLPRLFTMAKEKFPRTLPLSQHRRLLLCWAIPVLLLMSVVATKLPHYILPAWPALAAATAIAIQRACRERDTGNRTLSARVGLALFLLVGIALGLGLVIAPWCLPVFGVRVPATATGLLFLNMVAGAWHYYRRSRHETVVGILMAGMTLILLSASLFLLPSIERYKLSPMVASVIQDQAAKDTPVATCGFGEPSLNFYLGRGPITPIEEPDLPSWAAEPGKGILVVTEPKLKLHGDSFDVPRIQTLDIIPGFNYSQGHWVRIHILARSETP